MAAGVITIGGYIVGASSGSKQFAGAIPNPNAVGTVVVLTLASGDNAVAVPSGARAVLIGMPANCTAMPTIRLKGNTGDTGVALSKCFPSVLALDASQTTLILTASAAAPLALELSFL